jgi:hypothetical protein
MAVSFDLGPVVATPGALALCEKLGVEPRTLIARHASGDWGVVQDPEDNERALKSGARILSVYEVGNGEKLWVITDAEVAPGKRYATTLLRPEDY